MRQSLHRELPEDMVSMVNAGQLTANRLRMPRQGFPGRLQTVRQSRLSRAELSSPYAPETEAPKPRARIAGIMVKTSGALLVLALFVYIALLAFGEEFSRAGHSASQDKLEIIIANSVLHVPEKVIRFSSQRRAGVHVRLEMYLHWPQLRGYSDATKADFNMAEEQSNLIFLSVEPRSMSHDMSGRIDPIYSKFFDGPATKFSAGLVRQPLSAEGGFIDEDLFMEPDSPYPYAVRCVRETSAMATPFCLRDIHVGKDMMLTYRFHIQHLESWNDIERGVRARIQEMLVTSP